MKKSIRRSFLLSAAVGTAGAAGLARTSAIAATEGSGISAQQKKECSL